MRCAPPDAVLFDLDGTLADTAPDLGGAANRLRGELGLAPLPLATMRAYTSNGVRGILGAALSIDDQHADYTALADRFLDLYAEALCVETRLFDEVAELLDTLESAGIRWGVVTNKRSRFTDPLIAALGLAPRACCVISGDSAARPKPAPDPLLLACERSAVNPVGCVYVGDDPRDIAAGRAAGMQTVAAAYGYLGDHTECSGWGADGIIHRPSELRKLLAL